MKCPNCKTIELVPNEDKWTLAADSGLIELPEGVDSYEFNVYCENCNWIGDENILKRTPVYTKDGYLYQG